MMSVVEICRDAVGPMLRVSCAGLGAPGDDGVRLADARAGSTPIR